MDTEKIDVSRNLACQLTDDEIKSYGLEVARANAQTEESEENKKEVDAQLKAEIEGHKNRAMSISRKLNQGYEYRNVPVLLEKDYTHGRVKETRKDTGDVVVDRVMRTEERQPKLTGTEDEKAKAGAAPKPAEAPVPEPVPTTSSRAPRPPAKPSKPKKR